LVVAGPNSGPPYAPPALPLPGGIAPRVAHLPTILLALFFRLPPIFLVLPTKQLDQALHFQMCLSEGLGCAMVAILLVGQMVAGADCAVRGFPPGLVLQEDDLPSSCKLGPLYPSIWPPQLAVAWRLPDPAVLEE
jgi:hypothetical protein